MHSALQNKQLYLTIFHHAHKLPLSDYIHSHIYSFHLAKLNLFEMYFIVVHHVIRLRKWRFHLGDFATKTCKFPKFPIRTTCPAHPILHIVDEQYFFKQLLNIFRSLAFSRILFAQKFPLIKTVPHIRDVIALI